MLTTTLVGFLSVLSLASAQVTVLVSPSNIDNSIGNEINVVDQPQTFESHVREYFTDKPILAEVARCESGFRQFKPNGNVLRGRANPSDIGVMQINEFYHAERSEKIGLDIYTVDGNMAYAGFLYEKYGVQPWIASKPCWGKTEAYKQYKQLTLAN